MTWHIWTDGSCQHGLANVPRGKLGWGGWAAIVEHGSEGVVLRGRVRKTTNVRMEILAAVEGLRAVPDGGRAVLRTDCTTLLVVRDWHRDGRIVHYKGGDASLWRALGEQLGRVDAEIALLVRGHRDPVHRRAHVIAGAEARGGLRDLPPNAVPLDDGHRIRKGMRRRAAERLVHHRDCQPAGCVSSCPVWTEHGPGPLVYESRRRSESRRA